MEDRHNTLNGRYKLLQLAGSGGMASVYKGQDLMLGRLVAVKILHRSLTYDPKFLRRFQREAHSAANLAHPNIVTVHDIGQDDWRYYIVMEYVEGSTLKELVRLKNERDGRPLSVNRSLDAAIQICAGVGYAHRSNLVHCDIKSQNILLTREGQVKVADFGIARAMSESGTVEGSFVWGTPQYFSPEQAAGMAATPASDVYSIGVILFEMLTAHLPFDAESDVALAEKHMHEVAPRVSRYNPAVPLQVDQIISKVLAKEPAGRYRTADQFGRVLLTYRQDSEMKTGPVAVPPGNGSDIAEATTQYPIAGSAAALSSTRQTASGWPLEHAPVDIHVPVPGDQEGTDWMVIALGVLAIISLIGLIPLWYLVFIRFTG
jgi:serine/threonine-protein kinase